MLITGGTGIGAGLRRRGAFAFLFSTSATPLLGTLCLRAGFGACGSLPHAFGPTRGAIFTRFGCTQCDPKDSDPRLTDFNLADQTVRLAADKIDAQQPVAEVG